MVSDAAAGWLSRIKAQPVYRVLRWLLDATTLRVGYSGFIWYGRGVHRGTGPGKSTSQAELPGLLIGRRVRREQRSGPEIKRNLVVKDFRGAALA